jgi:hypothetical protein
VGVGGHRLCYVQQAVGGGGGGLLGIFGFLPLGLLGTILTYVGGPVMAVFLCLRGIALLLGY